MIIFVWAEEEKGGIGINGHLPWHLPADLHHFKEKTLGHPILMGRRTFASLPHLLPGRQHLVLTHDQELKKKYQDNPKVKIFTSLVELNKFLVFHQKDEICAIGGVSVFKALAGQVDILEKTKIHHRFKVDTYMPSLDYEKFKLVKKEEHRADKKNPYPYTFLTYRRI